MFHVYNLAGGDIETDGEGSGPGARAKVRVKCSVMCTGRIGLWLW